MEVFEDESYANNILNNDNFVGVEIIENKTFARVGVVLKDNSEIEIIGNKSEKRDLVNQRVEWFEKETEKFLSSFSNENILDINTNSGGFSALVSKEGFEELIKDNRIEKITWTKDKVESIDSKIKNKVYLFSFSFFILILLIIVLVVLASKKKNKEGKKWWRD